MQSSPATPDKKTFSKPKKPFLSRLSPSQLIALSFALAILVGGFLLWLPFTHGINLDGTRRSVNFLQAVFTATSALCVTGLNVIDPSKDFNTLGQTIIMLLIQIGGLGIITFGASFALMAKRKIAFSEKFLIAQQVSALNTGSATTLMKNIFLFTFAIEAIGAVLLSFKFIPMHGFIKGIYYSIFHSISAFNNAGFALYSDNLMQFVGDPIVSLTISVLIILGSMGFIVHLNLFSYILRKGKKRILTHTKLVMTMTIILLIFGTLSYLILEWSNPTTLANPSLHLNLAQKILASFFQSVTTRTAGFNTLDYGAMHMSTIFVTILLMFIGANPGGTGGGIKTSTFYIMISSAWNMVKGSRDNIIFRRKIDSEMTLKAMTVGILSMGLINIMFFLLLVFNTNSKITFAHLFFESVSAFGTVGLSMNTTPLLNNWQHIIIIFLMYLGRIGPLTFALAFSENRNHELIRYPTEKDILIG